MISIHYVYFVRLLLSAPSHIPFLQSLCFVVRPPEDKNISVPATLDASDNDEVNSDSDWPMSDDDETGESHSGTVSATLSCVRTNLCKILRGAVQPMASGRSTNLAASLTLGTLHGAKSLILTPLDFQTEEKKAREIGVDPALRTGDPSSDDDSKNFWFKFNRARPRDAKPDDSYISSQFPDFFQQDMHSDGLKTPRDATPGEPEKVKQYRINLAKYRRSMTLKPIFQTMHDILQGKSEMVLTCGIGVIRKKLENKDRGNMNCPLLEIDLCCRRDRYEFSPPDLALVDYNTKIRLCPSLFTLETSLHQADRDALQAKAQRKLD